MDGNIIGIIVAVLAIITLFLRQKNKIVERDGYQRIRSDEAEKIAARGGLIIDIRPEEDFKRGHAKSAINIPFGEEDIWTRLPEDKDREIVLYCRSGNKSRVIAANLVRQGYTSVYDLGSYGSWKGETEV